MDRDPQENVVDPVERVSPSTGDNDTGDIGGQQKQIHEKRQKRATEPKQGKHVPGPGEQIQERPE